MATGAQDAGMFDECLGIGHFIEVGIQDGAPISLHNNAPALGDDFLSVPLANRSLSIEHARPLNIVQGAMKLVGAELLVVFFFRAVVVEDLQFHGLVGEAAALERSANGQSVVGTGGELEIKTQHKICISLFAQKITATALRTVDDRVRDTVLHEVGDAITAAFGVE